MTTPPAAPVQFAFGEVRHARHRPVVNRFRYRAFFLRLRVDQPLLPRSLRVFGLPILGIERRGLISFRARDHGDGSGDLRAWVRSILEPAGLVADGPIWLHCFSRVLGYGFKPVSFWFCHAADGRQVAILAEVHNTFGERHVYLIDQAGLALREGRAFGARKVFHVSPFFQTDGDYRFRFFNRDDRGVARIDYSDRDGPILDTSLSGRFVPADRAAALHAFLGYPLFSLAVIGRIHWQAARLWWQRVPFVRKPPPPQASVSRGPASSGPKAPHPTTLHP